MSDHIDEVIARILRTAVGSVGENRRSTEQSGAGESIGDKKTSSSFDFLSDTLGALMALKESATAPSEKLSHPLVTAISVANELISGKKPDNGSEKVSAFSIPGGGFGSGDIPDWLKSTLFGKRDDGRDKQPTEQQNKRAEDKYTTLNSEYLLRKSRQLVENPTVHFVDGNTVFLAYVKSPISGETTLMTWNFKTGKSPLSSDYDLVNVPPLSSWARPHGNSSSSGSGESVKSEKLSGEVADVTVSKVVAIGDMLHIVLFDSCYPGARTIEWRYKD